MLGLDQSAFIDASDTQPGAGTQTLMLVVSQHRIRRKKLGGATPLLWLGKCSSGSMRPPYPIPETPRGAGTGSMRPDRARFWDIPLSQGKRP